MPIETVIALLAAITIGYAAWQVFARSRFLANRYARQAQAMLEQPDIEITPEGSLAWRLRKAGFNVGPHPESSYLLIRLALAAAAAGVSYAVGFPFLLCLAFAVLGYIAPERIVEGRIKARARAIDRELPMFYTRFAAILQTQPQVQQAMALVVQSMQLEGETPLLQELRPVASATDLVLALTELEKRAPTTSLASLAFALRRYQERGATGSFAETMGQAAQRLTHIIGGRNKAQAKAGDSRLSIYSIVAVLFFVYAILLQDPGMRAGISSPLVQIVLLILVVWMYVGLQFIGSIIEGVG